MRSLFCSLIPVSAQNARRKAMEFQNKIVVVTGGAHGIGKAIADSFRSEGAVVEVIDIVDGNHYVGDLGRKETLEAFASFVLEKHAILMFSSTMHRLL